MSIAKILELSAELPRIFDEAIQNGITGASETTHGIKSACAKEEHQVIENNKVFCIAST
ncbi:MAG: dodecin domain-containing protein [Nitrospirota bacterium]